MTTAFPSHGTTNWDTPLKAYIDARTTMINVAEDYGTASAQVLAAVSAAKAAGRGLYFKAGTYTITGDLTLDYHFASMVGEGAATVLNFTNGGIVLDGSVTQMSRTTLRDMRISRAGTAGPVLFLKGAGSGSGAIRFTFDNLDIQGSTGDGLEVSGSYIGTITGCYFRSCTGRGVYLHAPASFPTFSSNAISFHGGEIQQNTGGGVELSRATNISFFGTTIEGNTAFGAKLNDCYSIGFYNIYMEANGSDDILIGDVTTNRGVVVTSGYFAESGTNNAGGVAKTRSIRAINGTGINIESNTFLGWAANSPVNVAEASAGAVVGKCLNNVTNGSVAITTLGTCLTFKSKELRAAAILDFPSVAAGGVQTLTATVTGAVTGDIVTVNANPNGITTGIVFFAGVTAADTVTVKAQNCTTAAVDPASATFIIYVTNGSLGLA